MTFAEWWAKYDPDDVSTAADKNMAEMVWDAAAEAERERAAQAAWDARVTIGHYGEGNRTNFATLNMAALQAEIVRRIRAGE